MCSETKRDTADGRKRENGSRRSHNIDDDDEKEYKLRI